MSDQPNTPAEEQIDAANTPQAGTGEPEVNWQEKYKNLEADHTRAAQEAAQLRQQVNQIQDPEHRARLFQELAQELGYQIQDEDEEDPDAELYRDPRVDNIEQYLTAREQAEQQEQALDYLEHVTEQELSKLPDDLTQKQKDWITSRALAMDGLRDPNGNLIPDIQGAYEEFSDQLVTELKKSWANTKRAPHVSANGKSGTQTVNPADMSDEQMLEWQMQRLADLSAD